jgi:DNA-binding MarR family transcriptional regulator
MPFACTVHAIITPVVSPGTDVAEALGHLLRRTTRARLYGGLTEGLDEALDSSTYPVVSGLARFGPRSAAQLSEEIGIDRSVVSRHATRLEAAGLVARTPDPSDGRAVLLVLTDAGNRAVAAMRHRLAATFDEYFAAWPDEEARRFAAHLRRFAEQGPF